MDKREGRFDPPDVFFIFSLGHAFDCKVNFIGFDAFRRAVADAIFDFYGIKDKFPETEGRQCEFPAFHGLFAFFAVNVLDFFDFKNSFRRRWNLRKNFYIRAVADLDAIFDRITDRNFRAVDFSLDRNLRVVGSGVQGRNKYKACGKKSKN